MKKPGFFEGAAFALAASLGGSVLHSALSPVLSGATAARLLVAGLGLAYVLYLLQRTPERVGRITALAGWTAAAALAWGLPVPLTLYLLIHLGLVWLIRSLYFHSSLVAALADLGLGGLALAAGIAALLHTGSLFLALWSVFLVQALWVAIPPRIGARPRAPDTAEDDFQQAHRTAEAALRRLSSSH